MEIFSKKNGSLFKGPGPAHPNLDSQKVEAKHSSNMKGWYEYIQHFNSSSCQRLHLARNSSQHTLIEAHRTTQETRTNPPLSRLSQFQGVHSELQQAMDQSHPPFVLSIDIVSPCGHGESGQERVGNMLKFGD